MRLFIVALGVLGLVAAITSIAIREYVEAAPEETATITIEEGGVQRTLEVDPVVHEVIQGVVDRFYAAEDALLDVQRENAGVLVERNRLRHEADSCGERVAELEAQLSRALAERDELEMQGR